MPPFGFLRRKADAEYAAVEADDFAGLEDDGLDQQEPGSDHTNSPQRGRKATRHSRTHSRHSRLSSNWSELGLSSSPVSHELPDVLRRVSRDTTPMTHPTPGLQAFQRSSNIDRLEDSAAKMSLSMDIEAELSKLREEQKHAEGSRRSSIQNSRPASRATSGQLRLNDLPSPSAYIPISSESPFATSPSRSRHGSLVRSTSGPVPPAEADEHQSPPVQKPSAVSRKSSGHAIQSPNLALQTVFEDADRFASKEMVRGPSKASNTYSESIYSPDGGQRMKRDNSQAYSESMYSADKSPMEHPSKPLPLRTAYGRPASQSSNAPEVTPASTPYNQFMSPSEYAPEALSEVPVSDPVVSPSDHAPEAVNYQAYRPTPGGVQLVYGHQHNVAPPESAQTKRRGSAGSMDTYHQAATAFEDFDGAHLEHHDSHTDDEDGEDFPRAGAGYTRRTSIMTITQEDPSSRALLSPSPDAPNGNKHESLTQTVPSPELVADKRRSVFSVAPQPDSKRKSTMTFGPVRAQTPPVGHVFYPAPIPAMLNLPPKLAKGPSAADIQRKKGEFVAQARQSALRPGMFEPSGNPRASTAELDPHLKASLFFDHKPANNYELKLVDGSANKTLDAILDAAATAPLGAFTDHPYAGVLGPEVYGPPDAPKKTDDAAKRTSSVDLLSPNRRQSSNPMSRRSVSGSALSLGQSEETAAHENDEGTPFSHPAGDEAEEYFEGTAEEEGPDANNFQGDHPDYIPIDTARPTTLLAELQLRKAENKHRTRTAATAFPNGVHSTLLQLDAVAQHQAKARRGKQIRLAWEDPDMLARDADEDVPLGMLLPNAKRPIHDLLPPVPQARSSSFVSEAYVGGITPEPDDEKEETLGERKARLALEAEKKKFRLNVEGVEDDKLDDEDDDVPLAVRRARLHKRNDSEFTSDLMSQLGALSVEEEQQLSSVASSPAKKSQPARRKSRQSLGSIAALSVSKQPEGEETLGQRRRRLQAQQAAKDDAKRLHARVKSRNSSMDLLGGEPGPALFNNHADSSTSLPMSFQNNSNPGFHAPFSPSQQQHPQSPFGMPQIPMSMQTPMGPGLVPGVMPATAFGYAAPPVSIPIAQQMKASNPGQPAQPLGLLGAHMFQQQQQQRQPQYIQPSRVAPQPRMVAPAANAQPGQPVNPARRDMVDRWRQGVAS